jgi:hypothetical protein
MVTTGTTGVAGLDSVMKQNDALHLVFKLCNLVILVISIQIIHTPLSIFACFNCVWILICVCLIDHEIIYIK